MRPALRTAALLALAVAIALPAAAQPSPDTSRPGRSIDRDQSAPGASATPQGNSPITGIVANLHFVLTGSSPGTFMQVVPEIGYRFRSGGLQMGVPIDSNSASDAAPGASSHRGVGDAYLSAYYAVDSEVVYFKSTLTGTAPIGDATIGLGAGQATWNWTNYLDHEFDWVSPFFDVGVGNSINPSTTVGTQVSPAGDGGAAGSAGSSGLRGARHVMRPVIPARPYTTIGNIADVDTGGSFQAARALSFTVSAYDIIPWGDQTALSRFIPRSKQPARPASYPATSMSRSTRGQRFFELNPVTLGTASLTRDHGFGVAVTASPTPYFDVTVSYDRSVPMQLDTVSLSVATSLTGLFKKAS